MQQHSIAYARPKMPFIKDPKPSKVYVTKWALKDGLVEYDQDNFDILPNKGVTLRVKTGVFEYEYINDNEWFDNETEAIARAEDLRQRKIKMHLTAIARLEKFQFS